MFCTKNNLTNIIHGCIVISNINLPENDPMSALSEVLDSTGASNSDSDPVVLAGKVEVIRTKLASILLANKPVSLMIAQQVLADLKQGTDFSEIILIKNNDEYKACLQLFLDECVQSETSTNGYGECENVVQDRNFVQVGSIQPAQITQLSDLAYQCLIKLHFLPVYLLEFSGNLKNFAAGQFDLDKAYQSQVLSFRYELMQMRQKMIASNTGLVAFVARKYKVRSLSFEDLIQEGLVGLIKAVDRFDPERGNCFSTYAVFWIKQAISRLIVKQDKVVPLPVALAEKSAPVFETMREYFLQNERWPSLAELKRCCDLTEQEIITIGKYYQSTYVMDNAANDDEEDGMSVMEKMQQQQFSMPLDDVIGSDLADYMHKAVATLPEKQAAILSMRFGLRNHTEMTLQAVADQLQVTRERVRQIQNEALGKLKQQFGFDLILFLEPNDT